MKRMGMNKTTTVSMVGLFVVVVVVVDAAISVSLPIGRQSFPRAVSLLGMERGQGEGAKKKKKKEEEEEEEK